MKRREALATAGALLLGSHGSSPAAHAFPRNRGPTSSRKKVFVFVHGAWHCSLHWARVVERMVKEGHCAVAVDLPGSGTKAMFPRSYFANDWTSFQTEISPIKDVGLNDYVAAVIPILQALSASHSKVILVGHSFGGQTITLAAERAPHLIERLVYVTAFCPALQGDGSADAYAYLPENESSQIGPVAVGDPERTGAYRLNPRSPDGAYLERVRQAFYGDVDTDEFLKFVAYLNPDAPCRAARDDGRGSIGRWGSVPRTYVRCTRDLAIPLALQDRMIREADQFTPRNRFVVESLESSHSPFASMPDRLSALLMSS